MTRSVPVCCETEAVLVTGTSHPPCAPRPCQIPAAIPRLFPAPQNMQLRQSLRAAAQGPLGVSLSLHWNCISWWLMLCLSWRLISITLIILKLSSHRLRLSSGLTGSGRQKLEFGVALGPWHVLGMADCKTLPPFHTLQL